MTATSSAGSVNETSCSSHKSQHPKNTEREFPGTSGRAVHSCSAYEKQVQGDHQSQDLSIVRKINENLKRRKEDWRLADMVDAYGPLRDRHV
ncbi:hypothetical protein E2P81_ATG10042 [Venturia nashicola]|uniref:Uncharacterized protein n=1 Tax=Venturia nashicola TaxID=86259 RepID=A0A4Z1NKL1_9PEZI|nr:hypothetical protein E6O75_ATG10262 [Venturia nashicola]TLD18220.1 hypothetical protein E2P81_ATG10042 [Venturia nashicola]